MFYTVLFAFTISLALSLLVIPPLRRLALRWGAMDPVTARSVHTEPKPYLGGVAIYLAFMGAVLLTAWPLDRGTAGILVGGSLIFLVGLTDDLRRPRGLPAGVKFVLQVLIAWLLVSGFDVRIDFVRVDWLFTALGRTPAQEYLFLGSLATPLTVLWVAAFTNMINLIDGLDGLAGGIAAIGAFTLLLASAQQGQAAVLILNAALIGATVGFLKYNFYPARIIMGDAGSLFLGFALGAVAVHGVLKSAAAISVAVPMLALALPIFDTAFAIVRRLSSGRSIGAPDKDHLHHRLLRLGLGQRATVLLLWTVSAWLSLSAIASLELSAVQGLMVMGLALALCIAAAQRKGLLGVQRVPERRRGVGR